MKSFSSSSSPSLPCSSVYYSENVPAVSYEERPSRLLHSALHSVRKAPAKPWKKAVAPPVPVPTRVYKVDRINFREVVQQLTGASASTRLQRVAPPPLDLATIPTSMPVSQPVPAAVPVPRLPSPSCSKASLLVETPKTWMSCDNLSSPGSLLELGLYSPTSFMWSSLPILSPGTLSIF